MAGGHPTVAHPSQALRGEGRGRCSGGKRYGHYSIFELCNNFVTGGTRSGARAGAATGRTPRRRATTQRVLTIVSGKLDVAVFRPARSIPLTCTVYAPVGR